MQRVAFLRNKDLHPHGERENALLAHALEAIGIDVDVVVWDTLGPEDGTYDAIVVRTPWDYTTRAKEFLTWADRIHATTPVFNPPSLLRWNADKVYLRDLSRRGVPIVPTEFLEPGTRVDLEGVLRERGWDAFVAKPFVDAAARGAIRGSPRTLAEARSHVETTLLRTGVLLQPYLPSIEEVGETSLLYIDGVHSHTVRKRPAPGDWRVQALYGGTYRADAPTESEKAVASTVLRALPERPLYARIDLVTLGDGSPALIELEVFEPYFYADVAPTCAPAFARAVAARLSKRPTSRSSSP